MIRNHDLVPQDFLTTSKANLAYRRQAPSRVEREQAECEFKELQLKAEHNEYCDGLSKQFIQTKQPEAGALRNHIMRQLRKNREVLSLGEWAFQRAVESQLRSEILKLVGGQSFEEFKSENQRSLF